MWPSFVLTQPPEHVLDSHDRIINELANRNGETAQSHSVDAEAKRMKHDHGDQDRDRDSRQRNRRRAPVEQEQEQDGRNDNERLHQDAKHIVDRHFDEGRLSEQDIDGRDVFWQDALQIGKRALDFVGQLQGVGIRLLLYGHDNGRVPHITGVAPLHPRGIVH